MVFDLVAAALIAAVLFCLYLYTTPQVLSPDGDLYLKAGRGEVVERPFHNRWLIPWLCRDSAWKWQVASFTGLLVASVMVAVLARLYGLGRFPSLVAVALFAGLPICRTTLRFPVLVDGPALAFAMVSAVLAASGHPALAVLVSAIGGLCKEHVPVFASAFSLSPWPLVGLIVPAAMGALRKAGPGTRDDTLRPFAFARKMQAMRFLAASKMVLPWGACLFALWTPTPAAIFAAVLGYGMLFVAADSTRVYQFGAPAVCIAAAAVIPEAWIVPVVVYHIFNPWPGDF